MAEGAVVGSSYDASIDQYMEEKASGVYNPDSQGPVISNQAKSSLAQLREQREKAMNNPAFG